MHAIAYEEFGPASVLKLVEVPLPKRNPGEVLVKVHAAGVNPIDYKVRLSLWLQPEGHAIQGAAAPSLHHSFLITPGHDMLDIAPARNTGQVWDAFSQLSCLKATDSRWRLCRRR